MEEATGYRTIGGHEFPWSEDTSLLGSPVSIPGSRITLKNRIVAQPLEGCDATPDGAPHELTRYRYRRFLEGGAGLIWVESTAAQEEGRGNPHSLWIHEANLDSWKRFIDELKTDYPDAAIIIQLTHSGRFSAPQGKPAPIIAQFNPHYNGRVPLPEDYPVASDDYLDRTREAFVHAAELCHEAGADGVDVKGCHGYLFNDLLSAHTREGRYGGSFENRARLLLETIEAVKAHEGSDFIVASRICHADTIPYPYGFGMASDGSFTYDHSETLELVRELEKRGVSLLNISVGRPTVNVDYWNHPAEEAPTDTNEDLFARYYEGAALLAHAFPQMLITGSGYTLLKDQAPQVAAGAIAAGNVGLVGFGRQALAYPGYADAAIAGEIDGKRACNICGHCYTLLRAFAPTGCPTRDRDHYLGYLREVLAK